MPKTPGKVDPHDALTPHELQKALRALQRAKAKSDQALALAQQTLKSHDKELDQRAAELVIANQHLVLEVLKKKDASPKSSN
jgi:hypothetical protein